jgi:hypothetical protein
MSEKVNNSVRKLYITNSEVKILLSLVPSGISWNQAHEILVETGGNIGEAKELIYNAIQIFNINNRLLEKEFNIQTEKEK